MEYKCGSRFKYVYYTLLLKQFIADFISKFFLTSKKAFHLSSLIGGGDTTTSISERPAGLLNLAYESGSC